ncbi:type II toxin-antitoxin system HipA family toxin YjjJ [Gallaecimonas sp. GXIMD4217]|uniref:type II toxin-antitoxin system HipA family toxin YjjJ n=1 Tax=Gallaecimonas sp. GXIMD4217 TaxID=3131927 RepID=UPI00311B30CC
MSDQIRPLLRGQYRTAPELAKLTGLSQPTLSRRLREMGDELLRVGKARATRYYLRRPVAGQAQWPLYRVDVSGKAALLTTLHAVYPQGYLGIAPSGQFDYFEGLPWWLADMRPQGFMGRALARSLAAGMPLSPDPRDWSDDDTLLALSREPREAIGNLLVGDKAYQQWLAEAPQPVAKAALPELARQAMAGMPAGSSAGGEQPKFACYLEGCHCLVKFSAPLDNAPARRWGDLLVCESLALAQLAEAGLSCAQSRLCRLERRQFLISERFDRLGDHGRQGLVSLAMLDAQFVGEALWEWPALVAALADQGVVDLDALEDVTKAWCFGRLIGNSDMHNGNLSFLYDGRKPLALAPFYDMLPMAFAPNRMGEMATAPLDASLDASVGGESWRWAWQQAMAFWRRVSADDRISPDFRLLAQDQQALLDGYRDRIWRMA